MNDQKSQEPDIIITNDDLMAADEQHKMAKDFFASPKAKQPKPTALVDVLCSTTGQKFAAYFEQPKPNQWILVSFIDDRVIGSPHLGRTATEQTNLVKGNIDWSAIGTKLYCPYCHASALVQCGRCEKLSCHPDGKQGSSFHCRICGEKGTLSGFIRSMDGSSGKKR